MSELAQNGFRIPTGQRSGLSPVLLGVLAAISVVLGLVAVEGPLWLSALLASLPLGALALIAAARSVTRLGVGAFPFAVVWTLLVVSTFVWRGRTTQQLDSNPLDAAGALRVGLVAVAGLIVLALATRTKSTARGVLDGGVRYLALYLVVGSVAAVASPLPMQAFYRVVELAIGLGAILVARMLFGARVGVVLIRVAMGTIGALVILVWIEALAMPSRAWTEVHFHAFVPYILSGPVPAFTSNTVGTFGVMLAIWGLATVEYRGTRLAWLSLFGGLATLGATQYRTGVVALIIAGTIIALLRRRFLATVFLLVAMALIVALLGSADVILQESENAFTKGQPTDQLQSLNSRTSYWEPAWELTKERPIIGWGLNVGSRQAIVSAGDNSTSTAHSTWVEAMVGTGFIGLMTLGMAAAATLIQALRSRANPLSVAVVGLLVALLVRSLTGTTFELFSIFYLIFAVLAVTASDSMKASSPHSG